MNKIVFVILLMFFSPLFAFAENKVANSTENQIIEKSFLDDELVNETLSDKQLQKPFTNLNYNYDDIEVVKIPLMVVQPIKSEKDVYEGQIVKFRVSQKVIHNKKMIVRNGQIVTARVETIIANGMNGIPASIVFGDFNIPNVDKRKITAYYENFGLDLSLLVFPLKWALTILPPTGSLTNFIKGGHANIRGYETISIYYHPNW